MASPYRICFLSTILVLLIIQINGGYWICDWVHGRGWLYCSRGYCTSFSKKRSISANEKETSLIQNDDGTYCLNKKFCYTCQPLDDDLCYLTPENEYSSVYNTISEKKKRATAYDCA